MPMMQMLGSALLRNPLIEGIAGTASSAIEALSGDRGNAARAADAGLEGAGRVAPEELMSTAMRMGWQDGSSQARGGLANIKRDSATQRALQRGANASSQSLDDLTAMAIIESTGNRNVGTNAFGYTGLMQMGQAAAQDVGMRYSSLVGGGNVDNNALAGAKYMDLNSKRLDPDIERNPLHLYLAHQQGAGGTNALMETLRTNPDARANRNQRNNLPRSVVEALGGSVTQQDFYDYWNGKMTSIQSSIRRDRER